MGPNEINEMRNNLISTTPVWRKKLHVVTKLRYHPFFLAVAVAVNDNSYQRVVLPSLHSDGNSDFVIRHGKRLRWFRHLAGIPPGRLLSAIFCRRPVRRSMFHMARKYLGSELQTVQTVIPIVFHVLVKVL